MNSPRHETGPVKPKILVAEDEPDIADIISLLLEGELEATCLVAHSVAEAVRHLNEAGDLDLVVSDVRLGDGTGFGILEEARKRQAGLPFVFCTAEDPEKMREQIKALGGAVDLVRKPDFLAPLLASARKFLSAGSPDGEVKFCRVKVSLLLRLGLLEYEIYIKLSDRKFVRVSNPGEEFTKEDARRYQAKGVEYLYLSRADSSRLLKDLYRSFQILVEKPTSPDVVFEVQAGVLATAHEFARVFGFTADTCELIGAAVSHSHQFLLKQSATIGSLRKLLSLEHGYFATHSILLSYVSGIIAKLMHWDSDLTYLKLCYASVLHDISLSEYEVEHIRELEKKVGPPDPSRDQDPAVTQFMSHPFRSAEILAKLKDVPIETDVLVLQHHERPDGTGYPSGLHHSRIGPLSALMIFSCDLVDYLLVHAKGRAETDKIREFLLLKADHYAQGTFRKIHQCLMECLSSAGEL